MVEQAAVSGVALGEGEEPDEGGVGGSIPVNKAVALVPGGTRGGGARGGRVRRFLFLGVLHWYVREKGEWTERERA